LRLYERRVFIAARCPTSVKSGNRTGTEKMVR
jgi:hypothetical protein